MKNVRLYQTFAFIDISSNIFFISCEFNVPFPLAEYLYAIEAFVSKDSRYQYELIWGMFERDSGQLQHGSISGRAKISSNGFPVW